jgi:2-oxoisovalerate dehydrogenase E1 component
MTEKYHGLSKDDLIDMYRNMLIARFGDDAEIKLKIQGQAFFQINGAGHEGALVAAGKALKSAHDWFYPYYRDRALVNQLGQSAYESLLEATGAEDDPNSHGRQMPAHWGDLRFNIVSQSSCTGMQFNQAAGCAEAGRYLNDPPVDLKGTIAENLKSNPDEVVYVSSGDGTTSEGEFWESLNTSSNLKLPVIYHIEDNGYAISVPRWVNTAGDDISKLVSGFPDLHIETVDGTDPLESYGAFKRASEHCRSGKGPALIRSMMTRPYSHSLSDDQSSYRTPDELEEEKKSDCVEKFARLLVSENIFSESEIKEFQEKIRAEVSEAADKAIEAPKPNPSTATKHVFSETVDPTSSQFETEKDVTDSEAIPMAGAINKTLFSEMRRDPRIIMFGEDVADLSNEDNYDVCKGKGGVFKLTYGLQKEFSSKRVFNSPLAEANIIGRAIGWATRGLKPVVEIQFFDYIWPAFMQLRNEMGTQRYRSAGDWTCPMVVRTAYGGYLKGGAIFHSQTGEALFAHSPGIRVVLPSNAEDAAGLLRTAIRCDDPVLFLEHKHLYYQGYNRAPYPGDDYMIPFGKAALKKEGTDLTVVTWGATVQKSIEAAKNLEDRDGVSIEVLDMRTIQPLDTESVKTSVKKTGRLAIVHEEQKFAGMGAEVSATITEECFEYLDAPVFRMGSLNSPVGYSPPLEDAILPQTEGIGQFFEQALQY